MCEGEEEEEETTEKIGVERRQTGEKRRLEGRTGKRSMEGMERELEVGRQGGT